MKNKEIEKHNKILFGILLTIGIITLVIILSYVTYDSVKTFEIDGMSYNIMKEGDINFYHTSFVSNNINLHRAIQYNVYLRTDPRVTKEIPFDGDLYVTNTLVWQSDGSNEEFNCEGDGVISIANFNQILSALGRSYMRDENATCDNSQNYTLLRLTEGDENRILRTGYSCYDLQINNCQILNVTERFLLETFDAIPEGYKIKN